MPRDDSPFLCRNKRIEQEDADIAFSRGPALRTGELKERLAVSSRFRRVTGLQFNRILCYPINRTSCLPKFTSTLGSQQQQVKQ